MPTSSAASWQPTPPGAPLPAASGNSRRARNASSWSSNAPPRCRYSDSATYASTGAPSWFVCTTPFLDVLHSSARLQQLRRIGAHPAVLARHNEDK